MNLQNIFNIEDEIYYFVEQQEKKLDLLNDNYMTPIMEYNQAKILHSLQLNKLASNDFNWTTGYGYGDYGRDKVEKIFANVFCTESAIVRPNIVSGTHAIFLTLSALLSPREHLLSLGGDLYDTMQKAIGLTGNEPGNLLASDIEYSQVPLKDGKMQVDQFCKYIKPNTKIAMIQRSTGYSDRSAFTIEEIENAIKKVRELYPEIIVFIDNCYGEFTDKLEPTEIGADILAGSLIKNPGGGLAFSGGYIVGSETLIKIIINRLTAPGIGGDCGLTFGMTRQILQGLFIAPKVVFDTMRGAKLFALCFENLGFKCIPSSIEKRSDIIQSIILKDPNLLKKFCQSIQSSSPVDSYFTPEPWKMPGYEDEVIMAAGGFIEGSSIELSADGPMREPYTVYLQGGLTFSHCKIALLNALQDLKNDNLLSF